MGIAHRVTARTLLAGIAAAAAVAGAGAIAVAPASAATGPAIACAGDRCTNAGDTVGLGFGTYTCPNGIAYPSVAIVWPHSTSTVYPANCNPAVFPGTYR